MFALGAVLVAVRGRTVLNYTLRMHHGQDTSRFQSLRMCPAIAAFVLVVVIGGGGTTLHAQSPSSPDRIRLVPVTTAPTYHVNPGYDPVWQERIRAGIDAARSLLGDYGPVHVFVFGEESDELADEAVRTRLIEDYCALRRQDPGAETDCLKFPGRELIEKARKGRESEAYLSWVPGIEPPFAELVFTNPHAMGGPIETRGIHEYTHVFQISHAATPTWMMEGGAEFMASCIGSMHGWCDFKQELERMLDSMAYRLHLETEFKKPEDFHARYGIAMMEDIDAADEEVKPYYWHLGYMTGTWAVAYMIHCSEGRSVREYCTRFHDLIDELGWEPALVEYTGFDDKQAFYDAFGTFIVSPSEERSRILDEIRVDFPTSDATAVDTGTGSGQEDGLDD